MGVEVMGGTDCIELMVGGGTHWRFSGGRAYYECQNGNRAEVIDHPESLGKPEPPHPPQHTHFVQSTRLFVYFLFSSFTSALGEVRKTKVEGLEEEEEEGGKKPASLVKCEGTKSSSLSSLDFLNLGCKG